MRLISFTQSPLNKSIFGIREGILCCVMQFALKALRLVVACCYKLIVFGQSFDQTLCFSIPFQKFDREVTR